MQPPLTSPIPPSPLRRLFLRGQVSAVVNQALLDDDARFEAADTAVVVASLAAMGQLADAELLLSHQRELIDGASIGFALYHLATAAVVQGRYEVARRTLGTLMRLRRSPEPETQFYLHQGIAQYRYATGRLVAAMAGVQRSGAYVGKTNSPYAVMLWHELAGHVQALTGDAISGLASLTMATAVARELGRDDLPRSLDLSSQLYEARYQQAPGSALKSLASTLQELSPQERFGRASVLLEVSRQHLLGEDLAAATAVLRDVTPLVLRLNSRRYEAVLAMRHGDLVAAQGAVETALTICQNALRSLNGELDALFEMELQGRRLGYALTLDLSDLATQAEQRLAFLQRRTGYIRPIEPPHASEPVALPTVTVVRQAPPVVTAAALDALTDVSLNHRQVAFLKALPDGDPVDVHDYRRRFHVSEITACRDLAYLAKNKFLIRLGKARATRYVRGPREVGVSV